MFSKKDQPGFSRHKSHKPFMEKLNPSSHLSKMKCTKHASGGAVPPAGGFSTGGAVPPAGGFKCGGAVRKRLAMGGVGKIRHNEM